MVVVHVLPLAVMHYIYLVDLWLVVGKQLFGLQVIQWLVVVVLLAVLVFWSVRLLFVGYRLLLAVELQLMGAQEVIRVGQRLVDRLRPAAGQWMAVDLEIGCVLWVF